MAINWKEKFVFDQFLVLNGLMHHQVASVSMQVHGSEKGPQI